MDDSALIPILVTGAHRSGTTWIGRMLAADPSVAYISEPLNVWHRPGIFRAQVKHWYQYICDENETEYLPAFLEMLDYDYHLLGEIRSIRSLKDFLRMGRDFRVFYNALEHGQRALVKDPFAVFSAPWLAKKLNFKVVISVRHPSGFVGSLKRLDWQFNFRDLLDQPLLIRDHLEPYRSQMKSMAPDDIVGGSALLWKMTYGTVHAFLNLNPDLILVRHDDLSRDPAGGFRDLYKRLGLDFTPYAEQIILKSSSSENPMELPRAKVHDIRLDSRANVDNWKRRLTEDEIKRVREITEDVSHLFYSDRDW